eukprot:TRINITY_DN5080_c0_g2_i1.p1 TRINITY_DN5080_c0_g2~~TRINITY_DN5080_c0_g2_i1.p1  ORF type:complete len:368 (-),score=84.07 TRINITY_DN5080_c0_g2_i1:247-1326(-)
MNKRREVENSRGASPPSRQRARRSLLAPRGGNLEDLAGQCWEKNVTRQRTKIEVQYKNEDHLLDRSVGSGRAFSVLSYNVLCQEYIDENFYLYAKCKDDDLALYLRELVMLKEIEFLNADVVCLQEVEARRFRAFWDETLTKKLGYEKGLYLQKTKNKPDGCAFFVKKDVFRIIDDEEVFLEDYVVYDKLERPNIAQVICLESLKFPKNYFVFANTHLIFNHKRQDLRLAHTEVIARKMNRMMSKWGTENAVFCGDFNDSYSSMFSRYLQGNNKDYFIDEDGHHVYPKIFSEWNSVHRLIQEELQPTTHLDNTVRDHIFYTGENLVVSEVLSLKIQISTQVPSSQYPSDHLPLFAKFGF